MSEKAKAVKAISPKDLLVYLCLRRYRNASTGESKVPVTVLVKQTSSAAVTVLSCIRRLEESGYITRAKEGRDNTYRFLSDIEASTYAFLDADMDVGEKMEAAVNAAIMNAPQVAETGENMLYSYVVRLEEEITELKRRFDIVVGSINEITKCTSLMTGREYKPLNFE